MDEASKQGDAAPSSSIVSAGPGSGHATAVSDRGLWLGGVPSDAEPGAIREMFEKRGLRVNELNAGRGFATLELSSAEAESAVLSEFASDPASFALGTHQVSLKRQRHYTAEETADREAALAEKRRRKSERKAAKRQRADKARLCWEWNRSGTCLHGDKCRFAHGEAEQVQSAESEGREILQHQTALRQSVLEMLRVGGVEKPATGENAAAERRRGAGRPASVVERYYTQLFAVDVNGTEGSQEDMHVGYINMHSNRICVVGVAPAHPLLRLPEGVRVTRVDFRRLSEMQLSGKKKKGSVALQPSGILCVVTCSDQREYTLRACIRASLLEVNPRLSQDPGLVCSEPLADGYLALMQPKLNKVAELQKSLLSLSEYERFRGDMDASAVSVQKGIANADGHT